MLRLWWWHHTSDWHGIACLADLHVIELGGVPGGDDAGGENDFFSVNPYVGIGIEVDLVSEDNLPDWGYGFHLVAGLEFVYESISVGLELSSNAVDMHGGGEIDNVAILLNIGIPF